MNYRVLGKSGIRVSEVGIGGHQDKVPLSSLPEVRAAHCVTDFGGLVHEASDAERVKVIERALDLGVTYFDTSLDIETESLGKALRTLGRRDEAVVTVVAGTMQYQMADTKTYWAKKAVAQDIDRALQLFGSDHLDVCITCMCNLFYGPDMIEGAIEAMDEAKQAGKIRAAGFSDHQNGSFAAHVVETYHNGLDMVMYPFNFTNRTAAAVLFPLVRKYGLGYVAMKPLARGSVMQDPELITYAEARGLTPAAAAFNWILGHDEVSVALGAVNSVAEVKENASGSR